MEEIVINKTRQDFLNLWLSKTNHDIEIRCLPSKGQFFSRDFAEIELFIEAHLHENVYYGVGSRMAGGGKKNVREVPCLWADMDFKDYAGGETKALERLNAFQYTPTIVIYSGNGLHVYWFFKEAEAPTEQIEAILRGIARALQSDSAVCDLARVMRLPDTFNHKNDPAKPVKIIQWTDNEYLLSDFEDYEIEKPDHCSDDTKDTSENRLDVSAYLKHYGVACKVKRQGTAIFYCLEKCLFEDSHTINKGEDNQAAIVQQDSGLLSFQCFHGSCKEAHRTWADARQQISGNDSLALFMVGPNIARIINELTPENLTSKLYRILKAIAALPTESEKSIFIQQLSDKAGIPKGSIKRDLQAYRGEERQEPTDNVIIAHPSCEVNHSFISLGFKETVIIDNQPDTRNVYLVGIDGQHKLHNQAVVELGTKKLIFDERDRILMSLQDKWSKAEIQTFIKNPISPEGLYNEIKATLKQYVEFQNDALYGLLAAWIIATYFHRLFNAFPFLFFYGKKQAGKSRTLDLLDRLAFNAIKVKGVSVPSMADSLDGIRGTFLMDQAESLSQKQNVELLGILADSYTPGGGKRRIVHISNKNRRVVEFETYSPKAFASIQEIDTDLKDRCIEIIMLRAEKEYPYPEPFLPIWAELRDKLYRLLLTRWQEARETYQDAGQDMRQRVRELWRPLDTILTLEDVPGEERETIKKVFLDSMLETQSGLTELEERLIAVVDELLGLSGEGTFTTQDLTEKMDLPDVEPFRKKNQSRWVGRTINKLYLCVKKLPKSGNSHRYFFTREHLNNILARYKTEDCAVPAVPAISPPLAAISQKPNGARESLDSSPSTHCAIESIDLTTNGNNKILDDDFVHEVDTEIEKTSMTCSDFIGATAGIYVLESEGITIPPAGVSRWD